MKLFEPLIIDELKEIMGEDLQFLLDTFIADSEEKLEQLSAAIDGGDAELIRRTAHSLKGSSNNVGASGLAELCESMELDAREEKLADMRKRYQVLLQVFNQTQAEIPNNF